MSVQSKASRRLEFSEGSSNKFWNIDLDGSAFMVRFGRIGTSGQTQTKEFDNEAEARKAYDKLVAEKTKKGYADVGGAVPASAKSITSESSAPTAKATAKSKSATAEKATTTKSAAAKTSTAKKSKKSAPEADGSVQDDVPATAPVTGGTDVDFSTKTIIDLEPLDWYRATFRKPPVLERGTPRPFDLDECLKRLSKLRTTNHGWSVRWSDLRLPAVLDRNEAHFWFIATTEWKGRDSSPKELATQLQKRKFDGKVTLKSAISQLNSTKRGVVDETALALANLLTTDEYWELLQCKPRSQHDHMVALMKQALLGGFRTYVVPYLSPAELERLKKQIRKDWDPSTATQSPAYDAFPADYYVAAAIGLPDLVQQVTSQWDGNRYPEWRDHYEAPQMIVVGLGSAEAVAAEWRRLNLKFRSESHVRDFIACTDDTALDCIADSIVENTNKENCEEILKGMARVRSINAAEPMLRCKIDAKASGIAREWLDTNVGRAVYGLIETAGGKGKLADAALDYLRSAKLKGYSAIIAEAVKKAGKSPAAARIQAEVLDQEIKDYAPHDAKSTPKWLAQAIKDAGTVKKKSLPGWASVAMLPPLIAEEKRLNDEQMALVLQLLVATPITTKHPLFEGLRENVAKSVRDEFVWKLFRFWKDDGYPSKEKWAMGAIAHLGDDGCVIKLTPLIRAWPGESQHARAVFGLECLRAIGSSVALMNLAGIAQKLKFKGLKSKAEQFVGEIAKERGLTRSELEDRVVPDCGLDEQGRREFSFGPRSFSFVLGGELKAMVRDETGKVRPDLPAPGAKDDPAVAAESVAEWKLLKKQIKDVATIQAGRLEQAMITGRRWNVDDFDSLLVRHPLMTHLAQKLIWAGFDAKAKRITTFRITEERDFADADDNQAPLKGVAAVGIVHPLELSESERNRWGQVLGDYEIVSPFSQLGRAVYALEAAEANKTSLSRFDEMELVAPTLVFGLEKLNWTRGTAMDGGGFDEHSKQFPSANVTAVVHYEGSVGMGWISPDELLTVKSVEFCTGMREPSGYGWDPSKGKHKPIKLKDVPPIVFSEVVADMQVLKSRAK